MKQEITSGNVLSNLIWRFAERCGAQIVQFIVSIVLARILVPEDYGVVALVLVFAQILQVFVDSGLGNALVQKKDADDLDFSSVFYFNVVWCFFLYAIIYAFAPIIANFYSNPALTSIIRVLCLTVVVSGFKNVQQAYVSKTMQFKKFFFATLIGTLISAVVGILMAKMGLGPWALVGQKLTNLAIDTVALWVFVPWRPKLIFSFERLKGLISYGWKLLVAALLDTLYNNLRSLIIGKMYSESDLAYYNQGKQFPDIIVSNINTSIDSVLLPAMSSEQDTVSKVKQMTRRSIKTSVYIMAPLMMGLAAVAVPLVRILLTEKWMECVPFLRIFCVSFMFYPIHTANLNAIKALGRSDLFLKLEVIKKLMGVTLLIISMRFGVLAIAISLLISSFISQIINSWPNKKLLNYPYIEQLRDILPSVVLAIAMGICVFFVSKLNINIYITLILQVGLGGVLYIAGSILTHNDSFFYLINICRRFYNKKRG